MKYIRVTMPDGSQWDVPAELVAAHRAAWHAKLRVALTKTYDDELLDWAANDMNWSDVQAAAVEVPREDRAVDYQAGWVNGEKEVIEKD